MVRSPHRRFLATLVVAFPASFVAGAVLAPPDPFTQVRFVAGALPVALVLSYLIAYRGGYEVLQHAIGERDGDR